LFAEQQDPRCRFSQEAIQALSRRSLPGNVRELRNLVSKALIFANGPCIAASDLPMAVDDRVAAAGDAQVFSLEQIEREMVFKALAQASGHHDSAARLLGISRRTLSRKLKTYGAGELLEDSVA
jgi:DNA-binding NtrC family response regulator